MCSKKRTASNQVNIVYILTAFFIALCLFLPVWQSSVSAKIEKKLALQEKTLSMMNEQKMVLQASVEQQSTPEYVVHSAKAKDLGLVQLPVIETSAMASYR